MKRRKGLRTISRRKMNSNQGNFDSLAKYVKCTKHVDQIQNARLKFRRKLNSKKQEFFNNPNEETLKNVHHSLMIDFEEFITLLKMHKPCLEKVCNELLLDIILPMESKGTLRKYLATLKTPECFQDV